MHFYVSYEAKKQGWVSFKKKISEWFCFYDDFNVE